MNKKLRDALLKLGVPKAEAEKAARADSLDDFVTDLTEATRGDAGTVREMYDELNDDFRKANSARDKLQGLCDAQSKEIEAFKEKFAKAKKGDSDTERLAWFGERQKLMALATEHKVDSAETMDNLSLLRAVVKADNKDMPDDASEDRLRGYLDAVDSRTDAKSKGNPWESLSAPRGDNADPPPRRGETRRDADPFSVQMHNIDKSAGRAR